jgi:hypothetical protein
MDKSTDEVVNQEVIAPDPNAPSPVTQVVEGEIVQPTPKITEKIISVRSEETGDRVYAVRGDRRYWVKNPSSLTKMGLRLGQEKNVPFSELLKYPEGEPIDLTIPNAVYPWEKPEPVRSNEPTAPHKIWA